MSGVTTNEDGSTNYELASGSYDGVPSRAEVEQILSDPRFSGDVKRDLALQYLDYAEDETPEDLGFANEDEFNAFRDKYMTPLKISDGDLIDNHSIRGTIGKPFLGVDSLGDRVANAYSKAKGEYDKIREGDAAADRKAVQDSRAGLEGIKGRSSETDPGVANSNEIFDLGVSGLKGFQTWLPYMQQAIQVVGGTAAPPIEKINRLYDEQRDVPFDKFKAGAQEFVTLADAIAGSSKDVSGRIGETLDAWKGGASEQAALYRDGYNAKNEEVAQSLKDAADGLLRAIAQIGSECEAKVDWVLTYSIDKFGDVGTQDMERILRIAGGQPSEADIRHCAKFLRGNGLTGSETVADDDCDLNEDTIRQVVDETRRWLTNPFISWMHEHLGNLEKVCNNTRDHVNQAWTGYSDMLAKAPDNPYADVGKQPPPPTGTETKQAGTGPGAPAGSGPGATGGAPAGTAPAAAGGAPSAPSTPPSMPEMPKPEDMKAPEPPQPPTPGANPVTGQPLETDPATGGAYPIDPATGEAIKDGQQPDTMTVKHGDSEISLTEPDAEGRGEVSINDGKGNPRDFSFDFGDETEPGAQPGQPGAPAPGQPGVPGQPGAQTPGTQVPGVPGQPVEAPAPGADPAAGFGPQGAPEQPPQVDENGNAFTTDESGGKVFVPGEDGKIHMKDGDLDIVAERPSGPDGPTVVTVTDASGTPTTYTLGEQADGGAGAPGGNEVSGELGGQPDQVQPGQHQPPSVGAAQAQTDTGGEPAPATHSGGGGGIPDAASAAHGAPMPEASAPAVDSAPDLAPGDQSGATSPQSFADAIGGAAAPGGVPMADGVGEPQDETQSGASAPASGQPGGAGLGAAPGGADPSSGGAAGGNGMGMMGGMGAMGGAGGGGGDDEERSARAYKVEGDLFDSGDDSVRISGTLGDVVR